jgi:hypothetical protein
MMPTGICSYSTGKRVALLEHMIMINANQSMLTPRVDVSLYSKTSSWLMPTSLCSYSTSRRVALLEQLIMINTNQYMLLLHG